MKDILIIYGILLLFCFIAIMATQIELLLIVVAWIIIGLTISAVLWLITKVLTSCTRLLFRK